MPRSLQTQTKTTVSTTKGQYQVMSLEKLAQVTGKSVARLPYSIRVLLENMLRNIDDFKVKVEDVHKVLDWKAKDSERAEIPFMPARVVMQDFTAVPVVVDLAAMRDAMSKAGGDPAKINPLVETSLVIDHSVQVDFFGTPKSYEQNVALEYERNSERYEFLKWAQKAFNRFQVVPPGMGIIHQVNLEFLARGMMVEERDGETIAYPDTLVGTDSHTTMINALGVVGWGVGGIEAEAVMLGQPYSMELPDVVGVRLVGKVREGVTATDIVLRATELLRKHGVVGKFVEYFGEGLRYLSLPDRATLANMAPEYGATMGFFPIDHETLRFLEQTNRKDMVPGVEAVMKALKLFREDEAEEPEYSAVLELDLSSIDSTLAGPKRPQDRVPLRQLKSDFEACLKNPVGAKGFALSPDAIGKSVAVEGMSEKLAHGSVVIAAITSCTNTSNPYVMLGAGLLARNAVKRGLQVKPFVKTSLAPGSQVVTDYLQKAGLLKDLEALHFNVVGYGCTTCIGNSGALEPEVIKAIQAGDLVAAAVLSGNRNFEGRVNPHVKANYLASPIHVVAFALAGTVHFDPEVDPVGLDQHGKPVMLKEIWPSTEEIKNVVAQTLSSDMFKERYAHVFEGTQAWRDLQIPQAKAYQWDESSTYIRCPPYFEEHKVGAVKDLEGARVLALLGDSVTTDHISPASSIPESYPAGGYLKSHGVTVKDFNSYGSRRGNHEVMMRGTFANVRLQNQLANGKEGGFTCHLPTGNMTSIYEAAMTYKQAGTPLIVIAGKEYGTGSSRDWAAKGTALLGVRVVIAETYERIHRSNLVGMGVLPLQFMNGENAKSLGLTGKEVFSIQGLSSLSPRKHIEVQARSESGDMKKFKVLVRIDTEVEVEYFNDGGILQTVLKKLK